MTLLDQAAARVDSADLVILALVESIRARERSATPVAIARQIAGAPPKQIRRRMDALVHHGLLELIGYDYAVSLMGAELMLREVPGWEPGKRESARRDFLALSASTGAIAPRRG